MSPRCLELPRFSRFAAFVGVLDIVEVTPDREFDVVARDDLAAQDRVTVAADAGCMVSSCHAGDVDSSRRELP